MGEALTVVFLVAFPLFPALFSVCWRSVRSGRPGHGLSMVWRPGLRRHRHQHDSPLELRCLPVNCDDEGYDDDDQQQQGSRQAASWVSPGLSTPPKSSQVCDTSLTSSGQKRRYNAHVLGATPGPGQLLATPTTSNGGVYAESELVQPLLFYSYIQDRIVANKII